MPKYLLVSDFAGFRLYDLDTGEAAVESPLTDLHKRVRRFGFIAGRWSGGRERVEQPEGPQSTQSGRPAA